MRGKGGSEIKRNRNWKEKLSCHYTQVMIIMDLKNLRESTKQPQKSANALLDVDCYANMLEDIYQWLDEIFLKNII